jgi:hypothetical protein
MPHSLGPTVRLPNCCTLSVGCCTLSVGCCTLSVGCCSRLHAGGCMFGMVSVACVQSAPTNASVARACTTRRTPAARSRCATAAARRAAPRRPSRSALLYSHAALLHRTARVVWSSHRASPKGCAPSADLMLVAASDSWGCSRVEFCGSRDATLQHARVHCGSHLALLHSMLHRSVAT